MWPRKRQKYGGCRVFFILWLLSQIRKPCAKQLAQQSIRYTLRSFHSLFKLPSTVNEKTIAGRAGPLPVKYYHPSHGSLAMYSAPLKPLSKPDSRLLVLQRKTMRTKYHRRRCTNSRPKACPWMSCFFQHSISMQQCAQCSAPAYHLAIQWRQTFDPPRR